MPFKFYGYDVDRKAIAVAQKNAEEADVAEFIEFARKSQIEIDYMDGAGVRRIVEEILDTPSSALALASRIMQ